VRRCAASSLVVVTDANVKAARGAAIAGAIARVGLPVREVVLEPGERNKTLAAVSAVWDAALDARVDRNALVVAAGGGVVGDLAGFAAACLLRGVRFVQAPTTLLSMVDSSVGGKTGFDHATGKNLIGAFHQPSAVVADLAHLSTLSARERAAGLAEVVKIALATDEKLLLQIEAHAPALARGDVEALRPIVRAAIDAKIRIVRDDERESGPRALLNLGHTVGHALEGHGGFDRWLHGEAVALGTVIEMRATAAMGFTPPDLVERSAALLAALGLPSRVAPEEVRAAWPFVGSDKKRGGSTLALPVVTRAGEAHVKRVPLTELRDAVLAGV
jgi:shikimate kinase/3-dehydroquinate synthase